jgi:hypothetical protein
MKTFKSDLLSAAACIIIFMASCSKEDILPVGTLGDPKDPSNGISSNTFYSPDLLPIPLQRQKSDSSLKHLSIPHGAKIALSTTVAKTK